MDSIGVRPGAEPHQVASALRALLQDTIASAYAEGRGELYIFGSEESIPKIILKQGLFEEVPLKAYRLKLKDLEGVHEQR